MKALQLAERDFLDGKLHEAMPLPALRMRVEECRAARDALLPWSSFQRAQHDVRQSHAAPVLDAIDDQDVPLVRLGEAYEWALYQSLSTVIHRRHPELSRLAGSQLQNHRDAFRELETTLQELECTRIAYELYSRPIEPGIEFGGPDTFTERALIRHYRALKRNRITLRNLIHRSGVALRQMKPCFMMSPTTVAERLPPDPTLFDIVIIDEASQMLPCDAVGAIGRGRQAVIVGDHKQLPPSTYFQRMAVAADDNGEEHDGLANTVESILDLSRSAWPASRFLRWHYRSRHSSLIQFSNKHFYDDELIVFPGPNEDEDGSGVRYHYIENGLYKNGRNPAEAEHVVKAANEFMEDPKNRDLSLAIVAMNQT